MTRRFLTAARHGPAALLAISFCCSVSAQTTQGFLTGQAFDSVSGEPVAQARVLVQNIREGFRLPAQTDAGGRFAYAALSPGEYTVLVEADRYQSQELQLLEMPVAGRLELVFRLRPLSDVWESGAYRSVFLPGSKTIVNFYGPDVDTSHFAAFTANRGTSVNLDTSVSTVVDAHTIRELPLIGRDVYTLLVLQPGVTADLSTARGLGLSAGGQRPSSSNFLLDGLENNDLLITGPLGRIAPEAVESYRISTNDFSAEYGRTAGFLANAITRAGSNAWHGLGYFYLKNEKLDANGFQENVHGTPRAPLKEQQAGATGAGAIWRDRLFATASLEGLRFRGQSDPQTFALPTAGFIARSDAHVAGGQLLRQYPAAVAPTGPGDAGLVSIAPPAALDQILGLARIDDVPESGRHRLFARTVVSREREPELVFNPYPQFSSPYHQGAVSAGGGWTWQKSPRLTGELRFGRTGNAARFDRPHVEVPQLEDNQAALADAQGNRYAVSLPASASPLNYRDIARNWEIVDNWSFAAARHNWKFGAGLLWRTIDSAFTADRDGSYQFDNLAKFVADTPNNLRVAYDPASSGFHPVPYDRRYRYGQAYGFAQDSFHATPRLSLNYGVRYDFFGAPVNTGPAKDSLLVPGAGIGLPAALAGAQFQTPGGGNQKLFAEDKRNWAVRAGISYAIGGTGRTLVTASYGIYYDRPFDNLWQIVAINREIGGNWILGSPVNFLQPALTVAAQGSFNTSFQYHPPVLFQPDLRNAMVQNAFAGMQQSLSGSATLAVKMLASRGRRLWTTDIVNRHGSVGSGRFDPGLADIDYRGNQGASDYYGFTTTLRFRGERWNGQIAYTWSHAIDNQSDPLAGAFENYNLARAVGTPDPTVLAAFTRQFDSASDRGNSDFDQRHNLVFYGIYEIPALLQETRARALLRDWRISGLGAVRSGLPFTVHAPVPIFGGSGPDLVNQRADLIDPKHATLDPAPQVPGGKLLLNAAAFGLPGASAIGTSGRNAFSGPGLVSADFSVARGFALRRLGESGRVTLRGDFYNLLNHANLNNPQSYLTGASFGQALYGRREQASGLPVLAPLNETARQMQVLLRLEF